ncbi:Charged multivesicular body protein 2A [Geranomyces variabilis]|nr:Charged multivesicular body protein 2A [Geranomyces variabilis]
MNLLRKPQPTAKDQIRATTRSVRTARRELDKSTAQLDRQEKQLIAEIKKAAKEGRTADARVLAKHVAGIRARREKNSSVGANLGGLTARAHTNAAAMGTVSAMKTATQIMAASNSPKNLADLQKTAREYTEQQMMSDLKDEMLADSMEDFTGESDSEDVDEIVGAVFDEVGLRATESATPVPRGTPGLETATAATATSSKKEASDIANASDEELLKRFAGLKA